MNDCHCGLCNNTWYTTFVFVGNVSSFADIVYHLHVTNLRIENFPLNQSPGPLFLLPCIYRHACYAANIMLVSLCPWRCYDRRKRCRSHRIIYFWNMTPCSFGRWKHFFFLDRCNLCTKRHSVTCQLFVILKRKALLFLLFCYIK
jgi:hypothetical protein